MFDVKLNGKKYHHVVKQEKKKLSYVMSLETIIYLYKITGGKGKSTASLFI